MLAAEGVTDGELGIAWVGRDEMRALKREHLGIDEATDVLSFPLDGRDELPAGRAARARRRRALPARSSATSGGSRSSTASSTCSGTTTARRCPTRERAHAAR